MAFTPQQMQALMMLFKMNGNQREQQLFISPPRSDSSRTLTDCSSATSGSAASSIAGSPAPSEVSNASAEGKRKHGKNEVSKLATYLCKNYLKSPKVWSLLYADKKYMRDENLLTMLKRVKPSLKQKRQLILQKQLDFNRRAFFRLIKRRVSSQRDYRKVVCAKGKKWREGTLVHTIEFSLKSEETETDDEKEKDESEDEQEKSLSESDTESESKSVKSVKSGEEEKSGEQKQVRRQLAKDFAERMKNRRTVKKKHPSRRKKQVSMKARGLTPTRKRKLPNTKTSKKKRSRKEPPSQPPTDKSPESPESPESPFKVGDVVSAKWSGKQEHGKWFTGLICGINVGDKTMHIEYEDGDHDKKVPWDHVMILE